MRSFRSVIVGVVLGATMTMLAACGQQPAKAPEPEAAVRAPALVDVTATARNIGIFSTFTKAVDTAELGATLAEPGPYTVFVPDDSAFAKLPAAS